MTIEHSRRATVLSLVAAGLVGCAGMVEATSDEKLGAVSSPVFTDFTDDFDTSPTTWTTFEEVVGGNTCYGTGIASVSQVPSPRRKPKKSGGSLAVTANAAGSTFSNHVLAQKRLPTDGVDVRLDYDVWAMIDPRAGDGLHEGQVGPEMSIQRTRLLPEGWRTMTGGVQYVANKWSLQGEWHLWTDRGDGTAGWVTINTGVVLTPGVWYRLTLGVDYATQKYRTLAVKGADKSFTLDLSARSIVKETKFSEDALWLTLESENAWSNCSSVFQYTVSYENVALSSRGGPPPPPVCTGPTSQACGNCGTQTRTCNSGSWSPWGACVGAGVCTPSATQACSGGGTQTCSATCAWGACTCAGGACLPVDLSAGQGIGQFPSALIDTTSNKLLVIAAHAGSSLFRCNLDGSGCTYTNISGGRFSGGFSAPLIDPASGKLLVVVDDAPATYKPGLYRCNVDGTSCSFIDISAGQPALSGEQPSAVIDTTNGKLLVVTTNGANDNKAALFRCNLDGSSCSYTDISAGQAGNSGRYPTALIDAVNQKLLVVAKSGIDNGLSLVRCELDGSACAVTDIDAATGFGGGNGNPSAIIDTTNGKLLVIDDRPGLTRCNLDGSGCTRTDISAGQGTPTSYQSAFVSSPVIANGKLLIGAWNFPDSSKPGLFACNLDGTGASYTDLSAGQGANSGAWPSAVVDTLNGKFLLVTQNDADGGKPYLFSSPLQ